MLPHNPLERIYQGPRVDFLVLNRYQVAEVTPDVPYLIISVTDPEREEAVLAESPHRRAVLRLRFHDKGNRRPLAAGKIVMTPEEAHNVLAFVKTHLAEVKLIVCQCEGGISRSAAIAAALSRILQDEDRFFFQHYAPNAWIYDTLLEAAEGGKTDYAAN